MTLEIEKLAGELKDTQILGTVKWFNNVKGYGFIRHASGKDVFVHYSVIADQGFKTLNEGDEVVYELDERVKGLFAKKVERRTSAAQKPTETKIIELPESLI